MGGAASTDISRNLESIDFSIQRSDVSTRVAELKEHGKYCCCDFLCLVGSED